MRFDMICEANGIEHRLTEPNHPWTNGQVERMNCKIWTSKPDRSILKTGEVWRQQVNR